MTTQETLTRLTELQNLWDTDQLSMNAMQNQIVDLSTKMQGTYDEYFELYKTLAPEDIPAGLNPAVIPSIV